MKIMKGNLLAVARLGAVCVLLVTLTGLAGCSSCKEFKARILELDAQVADLQTQLSSKETAVDDCQKLADEVRAGLKKCEADKAVLVEQMNETVMIRLPDKLVFKSGSDKIRNEMKPTLEAIAGSISQHADWDVYVEGYTDTKLIKNDYLERWGSNWELGSYRACAVVRHLTEVLKLDPKRFAAVSYGPYRPVDTNDTEAGRANNRFVQIVMHKPGK
ncbi:MAG: OmpA/MotB family protein [Candidatus Krumholzibacteriia bacterium]